MSDFAGMEEKRTSFASKVQESFGSSRRYVCLLILVFFPCCSVCSITSEVPFIRVKPKKSKVKVGIAASKPNSDSDDSVKIRRK